MSKTQSAPSATLASEPPMRASRTGWLLAGVMGLCLFYPALSHPLENLAPGAGLFLLALSTALLCWSKPPRLGRSTAVCLAAGGLFGLWAWLRWCIMPAPLRYVGYDAMLAQLWFALTLWGGFTLTCLVSNTNEQRSELNDHFALVMAWLLIGFALYGIYQYFVGYPTQLREYREILGDGPMDLQTQSLLHALGERRIGGRLGNPNLFAAWLATISVFAAHMLLMQRSLLTKCTAGLALALAGACILLTRSRGGLLTFIIALALVFICWPWLRRKKIELASLGNLAILIPFVALTIFCITQAQAAQTESLLDRITNIATIRERLYYWQIALRTWADAPLCGAGPGGFELHYLIYKPLLARQSQNAHSWFFQTLADLGLVGILLELAFWGGLVACAWRALRRRQSAALVPLLAALVLAVNGLFEFSHQWQVFAILKGTLAGLGLGLLVGDNSQRAPTQAPRRPTTLWRLAISVQLIALCIGGYLKVRYQLAEDAAIDARYLAEDGALDDAQTLLNRARGLQPDNLAYREQQASLYLQRGNTNAAWTLLESVAKDNPYFASALSTQAHILAQSGRLDASLAKIDAAIERNPSLVGYRLQRSGLLLNQGQIERAREDLNFIEQNNLLIWEYEQPTYDELRAKTGLPPITQD